MFRFVGRPDASLTAYSQLTGAADRAFCARPSAETDAVTVTSIATTYDNSNRRRAHTDVYRCDAARISSRWASTGGAYVPSSVAVAGRIAVIIALDWMAVGYRAQLGEN